MHFTYRIKHIFLVKSCQVVEGELYKRKHTPSTDLSRYKKKGDEVLFFCAKVEFPYKITCRKPSFIFILSIIYLLSCLL